MSSEFYRGAQSVDLPWASPVGSSEYNRGRVASQLGGGIAGATLLWILLVLTIVPLVLSAALAFPASFGLRAAGRKLIGRALSLRESFVATWSVGFFQLVVCVLGELAIEDPHEYTVGAVAVQLFAWLAGAVAAKWKLASDLPGNSGFARALVISFGMALLYPLLSVGVLLIRSST